MKRFLLFAFDLYYAGGGREDYHGDFDTIEEAREHDEARVRDFRQVLDIHTGDWTELR